MSKLKLLDTHCKAGGAGVGYWRAGFEVVGIDTEPQPNYPFEFIQGDAVEYIYAHGSEYDAIHSSPMCQAHTWSARRWHKEWPNQIPETREALKSTGKPYVIENVPGSPLENYIRLCGVMFGLRVIRHRHFESNVELVAPKHIRHKQPIMIRGKKRSYYACVAGHGGEGYSSTKQAWMDAMGIEWMSKEELTQAIPPAYTEYIGKQLVGILRNTTGENTK